VHYLNKVIRYLAQQIWLGVPCGKNIFESQKYNFRFIRPFYLSNVNIILKVASFILKLNVLFKFKHVILRRDIKFLFYFHFLLDYTYVV